jgi:HEPN domain-containing protein
MKNRFQDWLFQAEDDLRWCASTLEAGHYAQACFIAQQVAEKSLKALAYYRDYDMIKGHSVLAIAKELNVNGELQALAARLDQYYITTRYPDAMPAGAPFEFFTEEQAREARESAERFLSFVKEDVHG